MDMNVVEQCRVSPSEGGAPHHLLPLLHFDLSLFSHPPIQSLQFYSFQCSKSQFFDSIVPNLKHSLSITLKHFLPLAGNIVCPLTSGLPVSLYQAGDSVPLKIAVSNSDFSHLTGNHSKDSDVMHDYVPRMPPPTSSPDAIKVPVMSLQLTLFPNQGICIAFITHHSIADGASLASFLKVWASINKFNGESHLLASGNRALPCYDRTFAQDPNGITNVIWDLMKKTCNPTTLSSTTNKVRATFLLSEIQIQKLKYVVDEKAHVSSFSVVCGYLWSCLAKSAVSVGEEVGDDEAEYLAIPVDCRGKLNPALPDNYFGNCSTLVLAESTHGRLKGKEGFVAAVLTVSKAIRKTVDNERGILDGGGDVFVRMMKLKGGKSRVIGITGSPRLGGYDIDYGWGGPNKCELIHNDFSGSATLFKTRQGIIEIGLSMPSPKMDAFAPIFNNNIIGYITSTL